MIVHRPRHGVGWWVAAACFAALTAVALFQAGRPAPPADAEPTTAAVAVLASTADAAWEAEAEARPVGTPLEPGVLRLKEGLAQVAFYRGARVLVEGPAELRLVSPDEAFCGRGRLSVTVPPQARGFRIGTRGGAVVSQGTVCGLAVSDLGTEIHVFKGVVELHVRATSPSPATLREGEAVVAGRDGSLRRFEARVSAFASPASIEQRAAEARQRRYDDWRAAMDQWDADASLIARLDFEMPAFGEHAIRNLARSPDAVGSAAIVGCGRAEGRWPGSGALEFRNLSDRVRVSLPGDFQSLTLAAWVRVDGLGRAFRSLFMSDSFNPGAVHWQIRGTGALHLGIAGPGSPEHVNLAGYDSPVLFTQDRLGRWTHVAVVYDAKARQVTHYACGRPLRRQAVRLDIPLRIGDAEIGNWNPGAHQADRTPIRHFNGLMDEFSVYARALTDREIEAVYAAGSPQQ